MHTIQRLSILPITLISLILFFSGCEAPPPEEPVPAEPLADPAAALSAQERAEGFQLLFDGESFDGWRGFQRSDVPEGWVVSDGAIHFARSDGDINLGLITEEQFEDFDLRFEWRIAPGGNSGVFFHVTDEEDTIWKTGPEYQIVDNEGHPDGENPLTAAGSNYGLHGPEENFARPAGEYNEGRIVVQERRVEHWLNGELVVEYELWSDEWEQLVADSPFSDHPSYGRPGSGHIALQEGISLHEGGSVWYRNLRIRRL